MRSFPSFQHAYFATLEEISTRGETTSGVADPTSIGSGFGAKPRQTKELVVEGFRLESPRNRLLQSTHRRVDASFLVANVIWTMSGGHDVDMIAFYNPKARRFARDQSHYESSFGSRLFSPGHQLRHVERRLKADKNSRRASAIIYNSEDSLTDRLDVPCAMNLQFLIRDDRLLCICFMRSQSAALVMPYDVFLFTVVHELMSVRLGVELGPFVHLAASMHFYDDEEELIAKIMNEARNVTPQPMPAMQNASDSMLEGLVGAERCLRLGKKINKNFDSEIGAFNLDEYWQTFLWPLTNAAQNEQLNKSTNNYWSYML